MDEPIKELLYKIADDKLILGHRNAEWTGFGPFLEEDIAFSSMAQDKIGQSLALYEILHKLGEPLPDTVAFLRRADRFRNCIFVELPNAEYDFSLVRHFLFDTAESIRFQMLKESTFKPLSELAKKISAELAYHTLHADTMIRQLGSATEVSISRLQEALKKALPYAFGIFEQSPYEAALKDEGIFNGEQEVKERWLAKIKKIIDTTELRLPDWHDIQPVLGGREGKHSEHLQPLLDEMSEVIRIDPSAQW